MAQLDTDEIDGRRMRTQRSQLAMIEAALELIGNGLLVPTAQQVSQHAGVGIRTFFRHFTDMEAFFDAVNKHARNSYTQPFLGGDREGALIERIEHAVEKRGNAYDQVQNIILSTEAQMWHSEVLSRHQAVAEKALRDDLEDWLPEIKQLRKTDRESVHAIASFSMWHRLRGHQSLGKKSSITIVTNLLKQLLYT